MKWLKTKEGRRAQSNDKTNEDKNEESHDDFMMIKWKASMVAERNIERKKNKHTFFFDTKTRQYSYEKKEDIKKMK